MNPDKRPLFALAASAIAATSLFGATQMWRPAEGSTLWDLATANWDDGAVWGGEGITNSAVFAAAEGGALAVAGDVPVDGVEVRAGAWTFGGDGTFWLSGLGDFALPDWPLHLWDVKTADASVTVSAPVRSTGPASIFKKDGPGALTFTGPVDAGAIHVNNGRVSFLGNEVRAPRIRASFPDTPTEVLFDGVRYRALATAASGGDNVILGTYDGCNFAHCYLGEGGLEIHAESPDNYVPQAISTKPGLERDGGVAFSGGCVTFAGANTFNGGIHVKNGQLRVQRADSLGAGDVRLDGGQTFFVVNNEVRVPNRIVLAGDNSWMGSTDGRVARLGLTRLAFTEKSHKRVHLGRQGTGYGRVVLALADDSEPVRNFVVRGDTELSVDGGVFTVEAGALSPYFDTTKLLSDPVLHVERGGFAFDTAGTCVDLGLTPVFQGEAVTNFTEVAGSFANPGFESGESGWERVNLNSTYGGGGRYANGSAFTQADPAFDSPAGGWYYVVRQQCTLTGSFTVPAEGDWAVSFLLGCRPGSDYAGHKVSVTVKIDPDTADEKVFTIGPRGKVHPFTRFATDAYHLAAGTHVLRLETDAGNAGQLYESLLVDAFACVRREIVNKPGAPLTKKGAGRLVVPAVGTDGTVAVEGGTLRVQAADLDGAAVSVAAGARLELDAGRVTNATVSVAAGGAFSVGAGTNLIPSDAADFEQVDITQATDAFQKANGFWQVSAVCGWTFEMLGDQTAFSGVQRDGGVMSPAGWKWTPSGRQTAFLRSNNRMSRTVEVPENGVYEISFLHAARDYNDGYNIPLTVKVDDAVVCELAPRTAYYEYTRLSGRVELAAGAHVLAIEAGGGSASGKLLYIDDVRLVAADGPGLALDGNRIDLASGATLDLQNPVPIYLPGGVFVDGVKFTGGRARLERKGVTVTGAGEIQVGAPDGSVLLFR